MNETDKRHCRRPSYGDEQVEGQRGRVVTDTFVGQPDVDVVSPEAADEQMTSVTSIIKAIGGNADALVGWAVRMTADEAIKLRNSLATRVEEEGVEAVAYYLAGARFRTPAGERRASDLGTAVHAAVETWSLTGARPDVDDEIAPYLDRFGEWSEAYRPEYEAAEMTVYNPTYGYAGTCDAFIRIDGKLYIVDYKTSKKSETKQGKPTKPYPEVALQLAAYRHAELAAAWRPRRYEKQRRRYYLLGELERKDAIGVPEVAGGLCLHITPEHCDPYPVNCGDEVFTAFLYAIEAYRWQIGLAKRVIGDILTRPS